MRLDAIRAFLSDRISGAGAHDPMVLASAALMYSVIRADDTVDASERARLRVILRKEYGLSTEDLQDLETRVESTTEHQVAEFAERIKAQWDMSERIELIEKLWVLAWADGKVDGLEAKTIREACDLRDVPEVEFAAARKRAEARPRVPR